MGAIKIPPEGVGFGGIVPRTSERLLQANAAQIAVNCWVSSGELVPIKDGVVRYTAAIDGPMVAIHRIVENGVEAWLTWPFDTDVVKAPLFGTARWCYTGDGEPRITTLADATDGGGNAYPAVAFVLGIPKPLTKPTVTPDASGSGSTVERYYRYTFYAEWGDIELEGGASPISALTSGKIDDTWAITNMDASPPNGGTVTGVYASGETEFTDSVDHWLRDGEEVVVGGDTLTVTVTGAATFKVDGDYSAETTWARKAEFPGTIKRRLYRTTGTTGQWQLVADGITGTTYDDTLTDAQIPGDELISADWDMPPVGLRGIFTLPSGALGGFVGNQLRFSEPNQPHAWPERYAMQADYEIVAAGCFGSGVIAATGSRPFMVQGVTPGQMAGESWEEALPCVNKRSLVSVGDMVLYASPIGYVNAGPAGVSVWSANYFTEREWRDLVPETMVACVAGRRVFVRYEVDGSQRTLVFSLMDSSYLVEAHFSSADIWGDPEDSRMYYSYESSVLEFDVSTAYALSQDWMSKEIVLPAPRNLGAARVDFIEAIDPVQAAAIETLIAQIEAANAAAVLSGDTGGAWEDYGYESGYGYASSSIEDVPTEPPSNQVVFMFYVNGTLKASRTVSNRKPFSLPSGYKSRNVAVRVSSQCQIIGIELGGTKRELGAV